MKPTYDELKEEVARLRRKLSPKEDKEFTKGVVACMKLAKDLPLSGGKIVMTPSQVWFYIMRQEDYTVRDTTKLCRSLQALGWERGAHNGNLIFTITVEEYDNACKMG